MYLTRPFPLLSSVGRYSAIEEQGEIMKSRLYLITAGACAAMALGAPIAQAQLDGNWSYGAAVKSTAGLKSSSASTLAVMRAAGIHFHATAGKAQSTGIRPDDRSGPRGI
jgi:hypothetical protein